MNRRERDILIQQLFDGEIAQADFEQLQDVLIEDPEARKALYEYAKLHQGLCFSGGFQTHRRDELGSSLRTVQQRRVIRHTLAAAAAAVVALAVALKFVYAPAAEPAARLRTSPGSAFSVVHATTPNAKRPAPGTLQPGSSLVLDQGTAELQLSSGVTAIVRAPARLAIESAGHVSVARGISWFRVEKEGRGFQVSSRHLEVTDLGTEFGVIVSDDAPHEVHCFSGHVLARGHGLRSETVSLETNDAFQADPVGRLRAVAPRPEEFLRTLPSGPTFLHWAFDGGGTDGFASKGEHPAAGRKSTLLTQPEIAARPSVVAGRFGSGLRFDGNNDHLLTDWQGILGDEPRSLAVWIKIPPDQKERAIIAGWGNQLPFSERANLKFTLGLSTHRGKSNVPAISFGGSRYYAIGTNVADGQWHHVACSYRGGALSADEPPVILYLNGEATPLEFVDATGTRDSHGNYPVKTLGHTPLAIGTGLSDSRNRTIAEDYRFRGEIDELYLFSHAIDARTVRRLVAGDAPH
jgi:ferric-dicitrate binding protein FerR (iron transport regulator)